MRQTATLETVIEQVHQQSANHYDDIVPVSDMRFDSLERMDIAGQSFEVLPSAGKLLANRLRCPYSYLTRCPEDLQAENLNYWIEQEQKRRQTLFCRFDGSRVRAVFTERYIATDNMEILSAMLNHGFRPNQEVQYNLDEAMLVVKVPEYERSFDVLARDLVVPGISLANSEVGALAFCIEVYLYRLVCSNGLIVKASAGASRFKHISRKALDQFPETLNQAVADSRHRQDQFRISTETPVEKPLATIAMFNRQFQIGKQEGEAVENAWETEPGHTMFSVINAYTHAAQLPMLTTEQAYRLEKAGGSILAMVKQ